MKMKSTIIVAALGLSMLSSCNLWKKFEMPTDQSEIVAEYVKARNGEADTTSFGVTPWQEVFTDPVLVDLINQALANNKDLKNAKLNIDIAQAQLKGAKMAYFPSVALAPQGGGSTAKLHGMSSWSDMSWTYNIPLSVSWEVDVFGKITNNKRSAKASLIQSENYEQAVRSQIIGGVANCYYAISSLQAQLDLSRRTSELWKESIEVMKNLKLAGRLNETAVVQSTANYYSILSSITDLEVSLDQLNNTLSLLLNVLPQRWTIPSGAVLDAPALMTKPVAVSMLANRPDVRASEQAVAVAYYAVNMARANFYPGLNITASGGFTNSLGSMITNPGAFFINLAGQLTAPIFSRGANYARYKATKAQQEQAMNNFEYAILSAAADVSDAMMIYQKSVEKQSLLREQVDNLEKSVEYTGELLQYGTSTYLEVLTAQQSLLSAQMGAISARLSQSQAVINMYQSLGGGK